MIWVCNAFPHTVDIAIIALPGGHQTHTTGPPRDYQGNLTTDQILQTMIDIYKNDGRQNTNLPAFVVNGSL